MLTPEELEQIRQVVREEVKEAIKIDVSRLIKPMEPLKGVLRRGAPGDYESGPEPYMPPWSKQEWDAGIERLKERHARPYPHKEDGNQNQW